jgi:predicted enzyme related to lactoylglutathione lyase
MGKPIVHWEIVSNGPAKDVQSFYADLFGWKMDASNELGYGLIDKSEAGLAGGVMGSTDPNLPGHVTVYVGVDDPDAVLKEIESHGGTIVLPTTEVVPGTTIALFTDPWGSLVGLSKA